MRFLAQSRLTIRILFWVVCAAMMMFSVVSAFTLWQENERMHRAAQEDSDRNVSRNIAAISIALWNFDKMTLDATLQALTQSGAIVRAEVDDVKQKPVSKVDRIDERTKPDAEWEILIRAPDESKQIGTLKISESYADLRDFFARNVATTLVSELTKIAGLAALLFIVIYTVVARHLQTLAREVSNLKPGSSIQPVMLQRKKIFHDELDTLAASINHFRNQQAEAERALSATRSELTRISQMMTATQMAASIAHEINQPLGAITANSSAALRWLARAPPDIAEATAAIKDVVRDGHRAGQVIGSLRAMFQKGDAKRTLSDVNDLIREVLSLLEAEFRAKRISLVVDLHDRIPKAFADRIQLQQVFINLIENAIEAMEVIIDRDRILKVTSAIENGSDIIVIIEDTGPGIDQKNADRIFDTFFTTKHSGMGMGLAICKSIIEAHHGRLWASPRSPCGSVFHVTLPAGEHNDTKTVADQPAQERTGL
jgi:C4-dicarboxylate-specific signal transduction histidine kinase